MQSERALKMLSFDNNIRCIGSAKNHISQISVKISKTGFWLKTGSTSGMASRPQRVAVESFTDYFDTNIDHFHQKLRPLEVPPFFA